MGGRWLPWNRARAVVTCTENKTVRKRIRKPMAHDVGATLLRIALGIYFLAGASPLIIPATSGWLIGRFHLRTRSYAAWSLLQPAGWMYNFDNRFLMSPRALSRKELQSPPPGLRWEAVNHHTARAFTCYEGRLRLLQSRQDRYVYLSGRYRDQEVITGYRLLVAPPSPNTQAVTTHAQRLDPR